MVVDGETGLLVPLKDSRALAASSSAILHESERATSMGSAARDRLRFFTVSAVVDRLERVFSEHVSTSEVRPQ